MPSSASTLNSCSLERLSQSLQCSGRGVCKLWHKDALDNTLAFCECDEAWADPECRTRRRSQTVAYLLSMFFGIFGADQFYLGFVGYGILKLFTLGGVGIWWMYDVVRIGSASVPTSSYHTAADLPHFVFVLSCVSFAIFMGFLVSYVTVVAYRSRKRRDAMMLQEDEVNAQNDAQPFTDAYTAVKKGYRGMPAYPVMKQSGTYGSMP